ncbi:MAG TPA: hypothetical protein VK718_07855 [Ferruginibacter sp.]|nr:hypothetical protein [Ferruginibacter sp.]
MSCTKTAVAQSSSPSTQLNLIVYATGESSVDYPYIATGYWTMNYDGTNAQKLPITFASGQYYTMYPRLSPDGKTVFFSSMDSLNNAHLYSCSINGTNLKTLANQTYSTNGAYIEVGGAY